VQGIVDEAHLNPVGVSHGGEDGGISLGKAVTTRPGTHDGQRLVQLCGRCVLHEFGGRLVGQGRSRHNVVAVWDDQGRHVLTVGGSMGAAAVKGLHVGHVKGSASRGRPRSCGIKVRAVLAQNICGVPPAVKQREGVPRVLLEVLHICCRRVDVD